MLIKNFIRLIVLGLLLVITSPANQVKAQYDSDYGIDHGPLAPALSSEEIREIEKLFEEAKTEEAFKELWTIFKSFILAYKIGDSPKLVEAYEKFMAVRKIAVNCGVRLKDTKTKLGSILNAPAKELADFVTFTRPGTKTSIGLEIELLGSYSNMKAEVVECHFSKDIPSGEAAKIKTVFNQEIKSKLSGKTYTDLDVARADIETYIISFLNALDKQLTFKGNADQETPDFDGEISLSDIPAFDEKKRNAEEVLTFQDFAGLPPEAARQISELLKNFESNKLESKKFHCRVVVTNEASKALPIEKDGISGTGSVFNDVTKQFNSDMAITGGRDMALWLHYDESLKKLRYKVVLKGSQISPLFVFDREKNPNEPNPTELDGIRKRAIQSAIKNTNLHSKSTTITDKQLSWVEMAIWAGRVGKEVLAEIKVPEPMWNSEVAEKYPVRVPPGVAGVGDGIIEEYKDLPELLTMALSVFDKDEFEKLVNTISSIKPAEMVKTMFQERVDKYLNNGPDVMQHQLGKDAVWVTKVMVGGVAALGVVLASKKGLKTFEDVVKSLSKEVQDKIGKLSKKDDFLKDIAENKELLEKVKVNPELIDSWQTIAKHTEIRKHIPSLEKVSDLLKDKDFIGKLPKGKEDLEAIIGAIKNPLNDGTASKLVKLSDHLENIKHLVKNHSDADGFQRLLGDLKNPNFAMQDGVSHMLNDVKNFKSKTIKKFDYEFEGDGVLCTRCRFDVEMISGSPRLIEYKSWSLLNIKNISTRQLGEYFRSANNIDDIKYIFNKLKTPDKMAIKNQMKEVFLGNSSEFFQVLKQSARVDLGADNLLDFIDLINDTNSKLYSFIDIR